MTDSNKSLIDDIRAASRLMVRELGFMESTVAATDYPPSAVHTILEIGINGPMPAMQLGRVLHLEKSSISRLLRKMDFGAVHEDGSIVVVFAETDLRTAHSIARRPGMLTRAVSSFSADAIFSRIAGICGAIFGASAINVASTFIGRA